MPPWFWELLILAPLALLGGRILHRLLNRLAPLPWRERHLPPPLEDSAYILGGEFTFYLVLTGLGFTIFLMCAPIGPGWLRIVIPPMVLLALGWGNYSLVHRRFWWILEPGCPLRAQLDAFAQKLDICPRRVRLRESPKRKPRVFLDGSIELTTSFYANLPDDERQFLLAATLHQYKNRQPLRRLRAFLGIYLTAIFAWWMIIFSSSASVVAFWLCGIMFFGCLLHLFKNLPYFSRETLHFALETTGNLDAARRVICRVEPNIATTHIGELESWWEERQRSAAPVTMTASGSATPVQQQTQSLGRRP